MTETLMPKDEEEELVRRKVLRGVNPKHVGDALRHLREAKHLSLEALAQASGMHHMSIAKLEWGHRTPTLKTLKSLASGLGMSIGELADNLCAEKV